MIMTTRYDPPEIDRAAAEWAARRDAGATPDEEARFDAWLACDPRHVGAYAKAEAVLAQLDRVSAAGPGALRVPDMPVPVGSAFKRRTVLAGATAAGLAVAGFASQAAFLLALGLLDRLAAVGPVASTAYLREAAAVQTLTSPAEMGELFKVLALARGDGIDWPGFTLADRSHTL